MDFFLFIFSEYIILYLLLYFFLLMIKHARLFVIFIVSGRPITATAKIDGAGLAVARYQDN